MRLRSVESFRRAIGGAQLSYSALAAKAGCHKSTVGHLAVGRYRTSPQLAAKIEQTLGVDTGQLFEAVPDDYDDDETSAA